MNTEKWWGEGIDRAGANNKPLFQVPISTAPTWGGAQQEVDRTSGTLPSRQNISPCDSRETEAEASPGTGPAWQKGKKIPPATPEVLLRGGQVHGLWRTCRTHFLVSRLKVSYSHHRPQKTWSEAQGKVVTSVPNNMNITHCPQALCPAPWS